MIICGTIFLLTFGLFLLTMCPTIYWEDSAAFSAVHSVLGIPHSPGFPIYVILGKIFTLIPIGSFAFRSNLLSAFWGSLSLIILCRLILHLLGQGLNPSGRAFRASPCPISKTKPNDLNLQLPIIAGVAFFAFTSSFWLQTIRAEVYTLNIFFTLFLVFLLIRWAQLKSSSPGFRILLLFSFVLGLSLANHPLLIVTLLPAFLLFLVLNDFESFLNLKSILIWCAFFILGFSFYLYLPVRSSLLPLINWGKPDTLSGLLSYLLRTSQPHALPSDRGIPYLNRLGFNLSFPVDQFGLAFFWLGVVGAFCLFKSNRRFFLLTFSVFILNVLTATWATDFSLRNYDLLGYLLPSLSMFAIWLAFGIFFILGRVSKNGGETLVVSRMKGGDPARKRYFARLNKPLPYILKLLIYGLILLLPLFQIVRNFDQCNKRSSIWAYQYAEQILNSVKKDALILVGDDNTLTSLWYLNLSCGIRPDVKIVSISALMQKSYREQINQQYREIKLPPLELKDAGEMAYQVSLLNTDKFPIYSTLFSSYHPLVQHLRPSGYLFEFCPKKVILTDKDMEEQKSFLKKSLLNKNIDSITREHFGNLVFNLGAFYDQSDIGTNSIEYFLWALEIDPSNPRIYFQLGKAFLKNGDREKALDFFQAGLEIDPYNHEIKNLLEKT
jgi:tetratricopeptide (TPR) repeat protein